VDGLTLYNIQGTIIVYTVNTKMKHFHTAKQVRDNPQTTKNQEIAAALDKGVTL